MTVCVYCGAKASRGHSKKCLPYLVRKVYEEDLIPTGSIIITTGHSHKGYLPCDGRKISKKVYPKLFKAIGGAYGDSGKRFCLPNFLAQGIKIKTATSITGLRYEIKVS